VLVSPDRLQHALADRYRIEQELGRGGMATVFLADDLKHHRRVAIKVLHAETAAAIGPERFLREIAFAARLTHPNILPLHDSGEADGILYYVMPYVPGESLRDRLARGERLPIDDALGIAREVAAALDYAHRQGVVHRDIKPENILLADGHALVADFGIAVAMDAGRTPHLTGTGQVVGTPAYLSPEQATGSGAIDGRSDIYSLGCLVYEMVAGHAPFRGPTEEGLIFQHLANEPPPLTSVRPSVPAAVATAVKRAMAKTPVLRHTTAAEFAAALGDARASRPGVPARMLVAGALVALAVAAAAWWIAARRAPRPSDAGVVAVLPFRTVGPEIGYLGEGMVDLLAAKLTGEGGPRAIDPRTLISAWRRAVGNGPADLPERQALALCGRLGAGQMLVGSLVRPAGRLVITASWIAAPEGRRVADARVEGAPDSLAFLVDRLVAQLLARGAARSDQEVADLTSTSLPALQQHLMGCAEYRRGHYREAVDHYQRALALDSTFTLAAMGMIDAATWVSTGNALARAQSIAWSQRARLAPRERAYLTALMGPRHPEPSSFAERVAAWQVVLEAAPDRPEGWYELGDVYFHGGGMAGIADRHERARAAFLRSFGLDSTYVAPLDHLIELAVLATDTSAVRALTALYLALDPKGDRTDYIRWRVATALGDRSAHRALVERMPGIGLESLWRIMSRAQEDGVAVEDAVRADLILRSRAASDEERRNAYRRSWTFALNRGRPREALTFMDAARPRDPAERDLPREEVLAALLWDGDSAAATRALRVLAPALDRPPPAATGERRAWLDDAGVALLWRLMRGDPASAELDLQRVRPALQISVPGTALPSRMWLALLEAAAAARAGRADAAARARRLDSLLTGETEWAWSAHANLVCATLLETHGDTRAALAAARRRLYNFNAPLISTTFREQGRLAARLGDRAAAVRAYRHYLALRSDPEPALQPEVNRIRGELAALERRR
jgi:serine/threonine-protein kinase